MEEVLSIVFGFLGSFLFGLTAVILKIGVKEIDIFFGILQRVIGALPILLIFNLLLYGPFFYSPYVEIGNLTLLITTSSFLIIGDLLLMHILKKKAVGVMTPLIATSPIFTTILLLFSGKIDISLEIVVLTLFIIFGIFLVTYDREVGSGYLDFEALAYGITISMLWGLMLYLEIILLGRDNINGFSYSGMKILVLGIFGIIFYTFRKMSDKINEPVSWEFDNIKFLILAGLVGWAAGSLFAYSSFDNGPPEILTPIIGLNPLFAVIISIVLRYERLNLVRGLGILICVICSILLLV